MARTTKTLPLRNNIDYTINVIESTLASHGFENKLVNGENAWTIVYTGSVWCFSYYFSDNAVIIQAWLQDMLLGEIDMNSFCAKMIKRKFTKIMEDIESRI